MAQNSQADSLFVLPPEIIHSILSSLDKPTLTSCSLTSKSLLTHARQVLHQKVIIRTTEPIARLEEFSRVYGNPKLAEIVRELTFLGDFCSPDWWGHSPEEKESIAYILMQTIPGFAHAVTTMTFTDFDWVDLPRGLDVFKSFKSVTHLYFTDVSWNHHLTWQQFVCAFTALSTLVLQNVSCHKGLDPMDITPKKPPTCHSLVVLHIQNCDSCLTRELFKVHAPQLHTLRLRTGGSFGFIQEICRALWKSLTTITFYCTSIVLPGTRPPELFLNILHCPNLYKLYLADIHLDNSALYWMLPLLSTDIALDELLMTFRGTQRMVEKFRWSRLDKLFEVSSRRILKISIEIMVQPSQGHNGETLTIPIYQLLRSKFASQRTRIRFEVKVLPSQTDATIWLV